jgi:hypothetical protein
MLHGLVSLDPFKKVTQCDLRRVRRTEFELLAILLDVAMKKSATH